ncbi:hypothetical protein BC830DRAFT_1175786, partial [Chytriomyces sp. MP71]
MALSFAKLRQTHGSDVVDEFFALSWAAERARKYEYNMGVKLQARVRGFLIRTQLQKLGGCALLIQRVYRGFKGRLRAMREKARIAHEKKVAEWTRAVVTIQKVWKGYWSRKVKFDYYGRKRYLTDLVAKMKQTRLELEVHEQAQRAALASHQRTFESKLLAKLAGQRHHLMGTRAIPGVMAQAKAPVLMAARRVEAGQEACDA